MTQSVTHWDNEFDAIVVVSPMVEAGEAKNQDRAAWYARARVAAAADGVTNSPNSAKAAELATRYSPIMFEPECRTRLHSLSDLLLAYRVADQQNSRPTDVNRSCGMQDMLNEIVAQQMAASYQTTLVTVRLQLQAQAIHAELISCGDSACLVYGPDGDVRYPNREHLTNLDEDAGTGDFLFGPGDELLARIIIDDGERSRWLTAAGVDPRRHPAWLVCTPVEKCGLVHAARSGFGDARPLRVSRGRPLIVPRFLVGNPVDPRGAYCRVPYSSSIRTGTVPDTRARAPSFRGKSRVTDVLPDHFYDGRWTHFLDQFGVDSCFLLATDGLMSAFSNAAELWEWLRTNDTALRNADGRQEVMEDLHARLRASVGDDDVSFVWVCHRTSALLRSRYG